MPKKQVRKFLAIEGLRGWLAWAVVFSHLTYMSAFNATGLSGLLRSIGLPSVLVFIIVSGFVITHVILEKREAYGLYLVRRFARIFPLLAVTCFVGFFSSDLLALALGDRSFGDAEFAKLAADIAASNHSHLRMHLLAHLSMLHGAVPNATLMYSEYAFNMPAWSISLEWQFYVLAPLIIVLRDKRQFLIPLAVAFAASGFALRQFGSGTVQPGALPLAALYFAIGIVSRLAYSEKFETNGGLTFAVALAIVLSPVSEFRPLLIWLVVFFGLPVHNFSNPNIVERLYEFVLENRLAIYLGSRSYAIYLCHYPVISIVVWLLFQFSSTTPNMLLLSCTSIPLIVFASELAHRWIELPGIAAGAWLVGLHPGAAGQPRADARAPIG